MMHDAPQTKEYLKSARRRKRLEEYTAELTAWIQAHRAAWAGWPTRFNDVDPEEVRELHARMLKMGCPTCRELGRTRVVRSMHELVAEQRRARRRDYAKRITSLSV
jgi:hypothetical protein